MYFRKFLGSNFRFYWTQKSSASASAQDLLIAEIKDRVHDFYSIKFHEAVSEPAIEKCHFGNASGCVGALYNFLIRQNVF